jgi:hypothetical protein
MNSPVMPAEWAQDQRLSYGARGVLAELVDTAPGGEMSLERLAAMPGAESADVVEGYLVELEKVGYLVRDDQCWYLYDPHRFQ